MHGGSTARPSTGRVASIASGRGERSPRHLRCTSTTSSPFSIWRNNDLWNLLPTLGSVNGKKSDRIPDPHFLKRRKEEIVGCWDLLHDRLPGRFEEEIRISLIGPRAPWSDWQDLALEPLAEKCTYLIEIRGYEAWAR